MAIGLVDTILEQGAHLEWKTPIFKDLWLSDNMANMRSIDSLNNLYLHYHMAEGQ